MESHYPGIIVTREAPLIVNDPSATMHYGTVYMDLGAYIEIRAGSAFQIEKLVLWDDMECAPGGSSSGYQTLAVHEQPANWNHHIILTGNAGNSGRNGENGREWGQSGDKGEPAQSAGGHAPATFTITIRELTFDVTILSVGGAGGKGGAGGNGADGYDGESTSKPGGIGGDGGDGGNGSNGGNAASFLTVKYASTDGFTPAVTCLAASGGAGGLGGNHGRNGKYYGGTTQPKNGSNGSAGIAGQKGTFKIEKL